MITKLTASLAALLLSVAVRADIYVIMHIDSDLEALSQKDVVALYTGRTKALPNGNKATVLDYTDGEAIKQKFYQELTNRSLAQISSYWARLAFTGRHTPPQQQNYASEVIALIAENNNAIGYVSQLTDEDKAKVKVVFAVK